LIHGELLTKHFALNCQTDGEGVLNVNWTAAAKKIVADICLLERQIPAGDGNAAK
jgi:hypothetical protein